MSRLQTRVASSLGAMLAVVLMQNTVAFASCVTNQVPTPSNGDDELVALDGVSAADLWAVGDLRQPPYYFFHTLAEHWDGSAWSTVPMPNFDPRDYNNELRGVAARSSTDVTAVGRLVPHSGRLVEQPLALHWNGRRWADLGTPAGPGEFDAVAAIKRGIGAWAVGATAEVGATAPQPMIERLRDGSWSLVSSPTYPNGGALTGVASSAPRSAWAVGQGYDAQSNYFPAAIHWNGTSWTSIPGLLVGADAAFIAVSEL